MGLRIAAHVPANVSMNPQRNFRVLVFQCGQGVNRFDIDSDLLGDLAMQRGQGRFPAFALATGKLPIPGQMTVLSPPADQYAAYDP